MATCGAAWRIPTPSTARSPSRPAGDYGGGPTIGGTAGSSSSGGAGPCSRLRCPLSCRSGRVINFGTATSPSSEGAILLGQAILHIHSTYSDGLATVDEIL